MKPNILKNGQNKKIKKKMKLILCNFIYYFFPLWSQCLWLMRSPANIVVTGTRNAAVRATHALHKSCTTTMVNLNCTAWSSAHCGMETAISERRFLATSRKAHHCQLASLSYGNLTRHWTWFWRCALVLADMHCGFPEVLCMEENSHSTEENLFASVCVSACVSAGVSQWVHLVRFFFILVILLSQYPLTGYEFLKNPNRLCG